MPVLGIFFVVFGIVVVVEVVLPLRIDNDIDHDYE